jgi:peptide chain release factor subunit 3
MNVICTTSSHFREEPFIPYIDSLPSLQRNLAGPFMMPIVDKFADMGSILQNSISAENVFG